VGEVTDKEACAVHTINISSQRQYFAARCLRYCICSVFGIRSCKCLVSFYPKASDAGKTCSLAYGIVRRFLKIVRFTELSEVMYFIIIIIIIIIIVVVVFV
jgi:hypothetical protein